MNSPLSAWVSIYIESPQEETSGEGNTCMSKQKVYSSPLRTSPRTTIHFLTVAQSQQTLHLSCKSPQLSGESSAADQLLIWRTASMYWLHAGTCFGACLLDWQVSQYITVHCGSQDHCKPWTQINTSKRPLMKEDVPYLSCQMAKSIVLAHLRNSEHIGSVTFCH